MSLDAPDDPFLRTAAIVCEHIARGASLLVAERSEPEDAADSGWQFVCGAEEEDWQNAQVWALHEVLALDSSLQPHLQLPEGTVLHRANGGEGWKREAGPE